MGAEWNYHLPMDVEKHLRTAGIEKFPTGRRSRPPKKFWCPICNRGMAQRLKASHLATCKGKP